MRDARLVNVAMAKKKNALFLSSDPLRAIDRILATAANTPPIAF